MTEKKGIAWKMAGIYYDRSCCNQAFCYTGQLYSGLYGIYACLLGVCLSFFIYHNGKYPELKHS